MWIIIGIILIWIIGTLIHGLWLQRKNLDVKDGWHERKKNTWNNVYKYEILEKYNTGKNRYAIYLYHNDGHSHWNETIPNSFLARCPKSDLTFVFANKLEAFTHAQNNFTNAIYSDSESSTNGQLEGSGIQYYENGAKHIIENYKEGQRDGLAIIYYESGAIKARENYKAGQKNGLIVFYHENGAKEAELNYKDGKKEGLSKQYSANGNLEAQINYKNDELDGLATFYYESGAKKGERIFKNGEQVGETIVFEDN